MENSKKIEACIKLEDSTAKLLDRYAHFLNSSADEVVNSGLEYIFGKDKAFQQHLQDQPNAEVRGTLRTKKPVAPPSASAVKVRRAGTQPTLAVS